MYCLTRKKLNYNSLVQKICLFPLKETSHCKNSLALGAQAVYFWRPLLLEKCQETQIPCIPSIWHHHFTWNRPNSQQIMNFVPIVGPQGLELNWNKFTISCEFDPLQVKRWYHMFFSIKMKEYMEPELSGIFWVKMVAKNIVLGSPGTHFMHMRIN